MGSLINKFTNLNIFGFTTYLTLGGLRQTTIT